MNVSAPMTVAAGAVGLAARRLRACWAPPSASTARRSACAAVSGTSIGCRQRAVARGYRTACRPASRPRRGAGQTCFAAPDRGRSRAPEIPTDRAWRSGHASRADVRDSGRSAANDAAAETALQTKRLCCTRTFYIRRGINETTAGSAALEKSFLVDLPIVIIKAGEMQHKKLLSARCCPGRIAPASAAGMRPKVCFCLIPARSPMRARPRSRAPKPSGRCRQADGSPHAASPYRSSTGATSDRRSPGEGTARIQIPSRRRPDSRRIASSGSARI